MPGIHHPVQRSIQVRTGRGEHYLQAPHTFEPNYITPGQDATVSWEQPDFRFRNTSSTSIGIKASYADQKMTVSIYGIPIRRREQSWIWYPRKWRSWIRQHHI